MPTPRIETSVKSLFLLGVKLMGVWKVAVALPSIPSAINLTVTAAGDMERFWRTIAMGWIGLAFTLGTGLFLLFGAEWIADQVDLPEERDLVIDRRMGLTVGIQLIGIYLTAIEIPVMVRAYLAPPQGNVVVPWSLPWVAALPPEIAVALGLFMIFGTRLVVRMIPDPRSSEPFGLEPPGHEPNPSV
jgi:hypothetical protein